MSELKNIFNSGALEALKSGQRQLDMDGVEVGVSRQALDEILSHIEKNRTPQPELEEVRETLLNIQYHNQTLMEVCEEKDFCQEEKLMAIRNLMQSVLDSEQALTRLIALMEGK